MPPACVIVFTMIALRRRLLSTFAAGLVVALAFGAGYFVGSQEVAQAQEAPPSTADPLALIREAWDHIQRDFVGQPVDPARLLHGAIRGMLAALDDPYTVFHDPPAYRRQQTSLSGAYQGIGTTMDLQDGRHTVITVFEGSPAAAAGLQAGDILLRVDESDITALNMAEVASLIRGPAGTSVHLTVLRAGEPATETLNFSIRRAQITVQSVTLRVAGGNLAIIKIRTFAATTSRQLATLLRDARVQRAKGIILDLRDNPGGYLRASVEVAGQFLPANTVIVIEQLGHDKREPHTLPRDGQLLDKPMVVLVNRSSASGAEIVAGALADHDRAILIGEPTFGKGTMQVLHELSDGSAVRVTSARWLTPNGHIIQGVGLPPDVPVTRTAADRAAGRDPVLFRARQILDSPTAAPATQPSLLPTG